ncbi:MAG: TonB family protein [Bacteroidetes bacterium]|nr:TonB family protein [Bacteroidota bacterium]
MEQNQPLVPSWDNVVSEGRNELVFENKNKEYGAYVIRKKYNLSLLIGISISAFILTAAVLIPLLNTMFEEVVEKPKDDDVVITEITLEALPKPKVLPMNKPIEKPLIAAKIKFTIPEPTEEEVKEPPVAQTQLDDKKIGEKTVAGDDNVNDLNVDQTDDIIGGGTVESYPIRVDKYAKVPEGFGDFVMDNFNKNLISVEEINNGIEVLVKISASGELVDVTINISCGNKVLDAEAIRVIKSCKKKWTPAMYNGKITSSALRVPLVFPDPSEE